MRRKTRRRLAALCAGLMALALLACLAGTAAGIGRGTTTGPSEISTDSGAAETMIRGYADQEGDGRLIAAHTSSPATEEPDGTPVIAELGPELSAVLAIACEEHRVPLYLALAVIEQESRFQADALNESTGCYGLMQLNPRYFPSGLTPAENIEAGVAWLGELLDKYDRDEPHALTAYYYGPTERTSSWYGDQVLARAAKWQAVCGT